MKNLTFTLISMLVLIGGCSKSDADQQSCNLAPPSWIQGVWRDELNLYKFTFTGNNVVMTSLGIETDFCRTSEVPMATVEEVVSTGSNYSIKASGSMGAINGYSSFQKVGSSQMSYCQNELPCSNSFPFNASILLYRQ